MYSNHDSKVEKVFYSSHHFTSLLKQPYDGNWVNCIIVHFKEINIQAQKSTCFGLEHIRNNWEKTYPVTTDSCKQARFLQPR